MNLPNEDQWDETTCGSAVCQHPQCWTSLRRIERGHPRILDSSSKSSREVEDKLPTLTIVNITDTCLWSKKRVVQPQQSEFTFPKERSLLWKTACRRHGRSPKALHDKGVTSLSRPPTLSVLNLNEAKLPFSEDVGNLVVTWVPEETEKNISWPGKKRKKLREKTKPSLYFPGRQYASTYSRSPGVLVPPPSPVHFFDPLNSKVIPLWAQVDMLPRELLKEYILAHEKTMTGPEMKIELAKMRKNLPPEKTRPDSAISSKMYLTIHRITLQRPSLRYPEHLRKLQYNLKRREGSSGPESSGFRKQQKQQQRKVKTSTKEQEAKKKVESDIVGQHSMSSIIPSVPEAEQKLEEQKEEAKKAYVKHASTEDSSEYDLSSYYTDCSSLPESPVIYEPVYEDISDVNETMVGMMTSSPNSSPGSISGSMDKTIWNPDFKLLRILQASVDEDEENHLSRAQRRSRGQARPAGRPGMVTKTQKVDLGSQLPEKKKKKKKKVVAEVTDPETQYSVLNSNDYFVDVSPTRATSPSNNEGQVSEMPLGKRKKKKKSKECLESEATGARRKKSSSPRRQVHEQSAECLSGEKKKKRRKSLPQATSQCSGLKTSLDPKHAEKVSKASKKSKKHRKENKVLNVEAFPLQDSRLCEAGDALHPCTGWAEAGEQVALGQKRKQGRSREHSMKKKKKSHQAGDILPVHSKLSMENGLKKGSKKSVRSVALDYIPIDSPKASGKKGKPKKKVDQPDGEGLAVRRKKKKRKESEVKEDPGLEEEEELDTDLEVVLEKKGNMDEACIEQMRRKALQEEIDRESGKTEASEPRKWTGTQFGQWDTAGFANEEQKLKFLKLMGGFKHLSPSFSRPPSMTSRSKMALDKKSSDMLQQNLQRDYDRAMSWKYNRGTGLGFSSEAHKIYIDRNASKSIKLQD